MKLYFLLFCFVLPIALFSQQNLPFALPENTQSMAAPRAASANSQKRKQDSIEAKIESRKHIFLFGVGNLSDESFGKLNGGGKAAMAFKTYAKSGWLPSSYFLSFNKNATNSDTLLVSTLVFPEVGSHSFLVSAFWDFNRHKKGFDVDAVSNYKLRPICDGFFEFATKEIKINGDSGTAKNPTYRFNTLHLTAGMRFGYRFNKLLDSVRYGGAITVTPFLSFTNIPNEDNASLEAIVGSTVTKNHFLAGGVKIGVEINGFQIFADFRRTFTNTDKLPIQDLQGFNSNIGVAFNAEVFGL